MEFRESDVQRAIEQIMEKNGGLPSGIAPRGSRMEVVTNAGTFEAGSFFEAETVKGGKNYVIFLMEYQGHVYYMHGDRAKKVDAERFRSLIDYGDLVPVPHEKRDPERVALSVLGLNAMLNGLSFNDYLKVVYNYGEGSRAPV